LGLSKRDRIKQLAEIVCILRKSTKGMEDPSVTRIIAEYGHDSFLILIGCLLSLRAKDAVSLPLSRELFKYARTPEELLQIPIIKLERLLYSIGFYRRKARQLHSVSKALIKRFGGDVPNTMQALLSIKGIGRKTANVVLTEGFNIPAIAVDAHVHRIANRLGLVKTKMPEQTEQALMQLVPKRYWSELNPLLVMWGQNVCKPVLPRCSKCALNKLCPRIGVTKNR